MFTQTGNFITQIYSIISSQVGANLGILAIGVAALATAAIAWQWNSRDKKQKAIETSAA